MNIVFAVLIVTVCGLLGAIVLVLAAKFMFVKEDERIGLIAEALPGANCGACGYAGCADYAKAVALGAEVNKCIPGGAKTAAAVAEIMGTDAGSVKQQKAVVACQGSYDNTTDKYDYSGISSCSACAALYSGSSTCSFGCLGFGDCKAACKFDAIIVENGLARINPENCTGCGACASACPKKIIWVQEVSEKPVVLCANKNRGAMTRQACTAGCIGCKKCEKICPSDAIKVVDNVAFIDHSKCTDCRACVNECPVKAIAIPKTV